MIMKHLFSNLFLLILILVGQAEALAATKQMEYLDRGVVAVKTNNGVFISWRYLGSDSQNTAFNIYRNGTKLNTTPIDSKTNYVDAGGNEQSSYVIKTVVGNKEIETSNATSVWGQQYKTLNLKLPTANDCTYTPNDMSVGDVDGDGEYELFVKWYPSNAKDNSQSGYTGKVFIDCYKLNGTFLWRIDLGINIRAGAHYTQFQVFDYDGDGKAEMICKTAPGTKDGKGNNVIMSGDNANADYRNSSGYVLSGPEYLTVFDGETGAEINTVPYNPGRGTVSDWGDNYGNRVDRFNACTAYLDGVHPSVVMCRGYYTQAHVVAYDYKNGKLVQRWEHHSTTKGQGAYGDGNHNVSVADVDGDGFDEIILGSACIDHDGKLYYRTGFGHGDAMHVSQMDPSTEDLEGWFCHEEKSSAYGYELRNLRTGKVIFGMKTETDNGRCLAADIDAKHKGFECWSSFNSNVFDCKGNVISTSKPSVNFRVYWDGDLQDELLDGTKIDKWNGNGTTRLITLQGSSCNGTKATPCLSADILGDWREEVITYNANDPSQIYIYTTTIESKYRLFTLMHDGVYRCGIAWQNSSYNQPPHLGFYIGDGLDNVKQPDIYLNNGNAIQRAGMTAEGELSQELFEGDAILPITFTLKGTASGFNYTLIDGLTAKESNGVMTVSGIPAKSGKCKVSSVGGDETVEYEINVNVVNTGDKKRVAYITDNTNANYQGNLIIPMLKGRDDLYVKEIQADATPNLSGYDLIVIGEETPSTAAIMASVEGIATPMLSMKVHGYKVADGAWGWAANGYGDNTTATDLVVAPSAQSHPMFKDIDFTKGNDIQMFTSVNTKALTYMNPESFTNATGNIQTIASIKGESQVCILEISAGSSVAGTRLAEKYIQIGLNSSSNASLTDDALSIIRNACYYLLGMDNASQTAVTTHSATSAKFNLCPNPAKDILTVSYKAEESDDARLTLVNSVGKTVRIETIEIHTGDNVATVDLNGIAKGVYILKMEGSHTHETSRVIIKE